MVEFIRDVVVALALLLSFFALACKAPVESDAVRNPMPASAVYSGTITVAPTVGASK